MFSGVIVADDNEGSQYMRERAGIVAGAVGGAGRDASFANARRARAEGTATTVPYTSGPWSICKDRSQLDLPASRRYPAAMVPRG